jgi:hypothetical protein
MDLEKLLNDNPKFHTTGAGEAVSYGLAPEVLSYIAEKVTPESKTLETGSGLSTVLFASLSSQHICITPDQAEADRIVAYCKRNDIRLDKVKFVVERSETAVPKVEVNGFDLVLIDGNHAFPAPFIDYYYAADKMKVGGVLIVDDTQLWTGKILRDFLRLEPEWRLDREFSGRTACFIKTREGSHLKWWGAQPYVKKHSRRTVLEYRIRTAAEPWSAALRRWLGR